MPVVGFFITSSNISHAVLSFFPCLSSMCQLELEVELAPVAKRFAQVSQEPNVGLVNPFFSQIKRAIITRF